ncbi:MAG: hypothetical protein ABGZ35_08910 [Planctomycetaceae bacterium]
MKQFQFYGITLALAAGIVALPVLLNAQDNNSDSSQDDADAKSAEEIKVTDMTLADLMSVLASPEDTLPAEIQDPAFRIYVDISLLSVAWSDLNAVLMTDVALQLQAGEQILRRPHRAVSSQDLLKTAAKIAAENNDDLTLARIKAAAESSGDKELVGEVAIASKIGGSARDITPEMQIPVGALQANDYADLEGFLLAIRAARLAGDAEVLASLADEAGNLTGLTDQQSESLEKTISESLAMVKQAGKGDPTVDTLEKIREATRGFVGHFGHGSFHGHAGGGRRGGGRHGHFGGGRGHFGGHWGHHGGGHWGGHWGGRHGGGHHGGGHHGGGHWGGHHHH